MKPPSIQLPVTEIESLIVTVREQRVILAPDLAAVYGVPTKALNQAIKRNADKFPADFMFRLKFRARADARHARDRSALARWCQPRHGWWTRRPAK